MKYKTIDEITDENSIQKKKSTSLRRKLTTFGLTALFAGCSLFDTSPPIGSLRVNGDYLEISAFEVGRLASVELSIDEDMSGSYDADEMRNLDFTGNSHSESIYIPSLGLDSGTYDAQLRLMDGSGNSSSYTASFTIPHPEPILDPDSTPPESTTLELSRNDLDYGGMTIDFSLPADATVSDEERSETIGAKIFASPYDNLTLDELVLGNDTLHADGALPNDYVTHITNIAPDAPDTPISLDHVAMVGGVPSYDANWTVYLVLTDGTYNASTDSFADGNERLLQATVTTGGPEDNRHNFYGAVAGITGSFSDWVEFKNNRGQTLATTDYVDGQFWQYLENLTTGMEITISSKDHPGSLTIRYQPKGINDGTDETLINGLEIPQY